MLDRLDLTKTMAQKALRRLASTATIEAEGGKYAVVDPLLVAWLERIGSGAADET